MAILSTRKDGSIICPACEGLRRRGGCGTLIKHKIVVQGENISYVCNRSDCDFMIRTKNLAF